MNGRLSNLCDPHPSARRFRRLVADIVRTNKLMHLITLLCTELLLIGFIEPEDDLTSAAPRFFFMVVSCFCILTAWTTWSRFKRKTAFFIIAPVSRCKQIVAFWLASMIQVPISILLAVLATFLILARCSPQMFHEIIGYGGKSLLHLSLLAVAACTGASLVAPFHALLVLPSLHRLRQVLFIIWMLVFFLGALKFLVEVLVASTGVACDYPNAALTIVVILTAFILYLHVLSRLIKARLRAVRQYLSYPPARLVLLATPIAVGFAYIVASRRLSFDDVGFFLFFFPWLIFSTLHPKWLRIAPMLPITPMAYLIRFLLPGFGAAILIFVVFRSCYDICKVNPVFVATELFAAAVFISAFVPRSARHSVSALMMIFTVLFIMPFVIEIQHPGRATGLILFMFAFSGSLGLAGTAGIIFKIKKRRLYS